MTTLYISYGISSVHPDGTGTKVYISYSIALHHRCIIFVAVPRHTGTVQHRSYAMFKGIGLHIWNQLMCLRSASGGLCLAVFTLETVLPNTQPQFVQIYHMLAVLGMAETEKQTFSDSCTSLQLER